MTRLLDRALAGSGVSFDDYFQRATLAMHVLRHARAVFSSTQIKQKIVNSAQFAFRELANASAFRQAVVSVAVSIFENYNFAPDAYRSQTRSASAPSNACGHALPRTVRHLVPKLPEFAPTAAPSIHSARPRLFVPGQEPRCPQRRREQERVTPLRCALWRRGAMRRTRRT